MKHIITFLWWIKAHFGRVKKEQVDYYSQLPFIEYKEDNNDEEDYFI